MDLRVLFLLLLFVEYVFGHMNVYGAQSTDINIRPLYQGVCRINKDKKLTPFYSRLEIGLIEKQV